MAAHIDHSHALLGAVRTTITDALRSGITPDAIRDLLAGLERAEDAREGRRTPRDHTAASELRPVALTHPQHHDRTGTAGRTPTTLTVLVDASQARCDDCGSLVDVLRGVPTYRHTIECDHPGRVHYRHATEAHIHAAQAAAHARHIRDTYEKIIKEWDLRVMYSLHESARLAMDAIEASVSLADSSAATAADHEWTAARGAAMVAHGFLGNARGFLRLIETRVNAVQPETS